MVFASNESTHVRKLFWRFWYAPVGWSYRRFSIEYCASVYGGALYAGIVMFGRGIMYSDEW